MSYRPDEKAKPDGRLFTRRLSQRDLALSIPVNFVENPGVSLTAACFSNDAYLADAAEKCLSNLLAVGFRRVEIDVYWDASRLRWSLCPVQLGDDTFGPDELSSLSATRSSARTGPETSLSMTSISSVDELSPNARNVLPRQATASETSAASDTITSEVSSTTGSGTSTLDSTSSQSQSTAASQTDSPQGPVKQVGPYQCNPVLDLDWITGVMDNFLDRTETNLNATLQYAILNLHAAASAEDPTGDAEAPPSDQLPSAANGLIASISTNLSSFLYTPSDLRQQRADMNETWYDSSRNLEPMPGYYDVDESGDSSSTLSGWPSENFVEMSQGKRLFVGFGEIDSQMEAYDVSRDAENIFPPNYLQNERSITIDDEGDITSGCYYLPDTYDVASLNNSWAVANQRPSFNLSSPSDAPANHTSCGINPILSRPLQNKTADQDFLPYQDYVQSTVWSWAPGYPQRSDDNFTSAQITQGTSDEDYKKRCAALNASSGFWQNEVCMDQHYYACRRNGALYDFAISGQRSDYAGASCPGDSMFDVPRTGLQNTYLLRAWQTERSEDDRPDELLWLNFNNIDSELCWVRGQNSTCPYVRRASNNRTVVVPTIAAIALFALAVLTVLVKCASNRRNSKRSRRRRGGDGWDYEGVPS